MNLYEVMKITGLTSKTLYNIRKKAIDCGYNPKVNTKILASYNVIHLYLEYPLIRN